MKPHLPVVLRKVVLACAAAVGMTPMMGLHVYAGWSGQDADTFIYTGETTIDLTTSDVTQAYYLIRPGAAASTNNDVSGVVDLLNVGNGVEVKVADGYYSDAQGKNFTTDFIIKELRYAEGDSNNAFSIHANQSASIQKLSGAPADIKIYDAKELILGGESGTAHTVDVISFEAKNGNQNVYTRNLTIADGVSVTATKLENFWGFGTLTVDGTLNITDSAQGLVLSSGENASTESNRIAGSGVINTSTLICGNVGTYNFDIDELNVQGNAVFSGHGVHVHGGSINLAGSTTMNTLVTLYDGAIIQNNAASAIQFGSDFTLDIKNLTAQVQDDRSRVYTILSGTGNKDLSALNIDKVNVSERYGWNWSFNQNGTIVAEYKGRDISFAGGTLSWSTAADNKSFTQGSAAVSFEQGDNVTFAADSQVTLAEDIQATRVIVGSEAEVAVHTAGHALAADIVEVEGALRYQLGGENSSILDLKGAGTLVLDNADADSAASFSIGGDVSAFTGGLTVQGNTTLALHDKANGLVSASEASVTIGDGAVLKVEKVENTAAWHTIWRLNDATNLHTTGTGTIDVVDRGWLTEDVDILKNFSCETSFALHGDGFYSNMRRDVYVGEGAGFYVDDTLTLITYVALVVQGGTIDAGTLAVGNDQYWSKFFMSSGLLTAGSIKLSSHNGGTEVNISGGCVEFTQSQALNRAGNSAPYVRIVGSGPDSTVTLKATRTDWTLDGAGLNNKPVIGNITVDAGNTHGITLANVALTGSIVNNAELTLGEGISVAANTTTTLSGDGQLSVHRTIANAGTFNLQVSQVSLDRSNLEYLQSGIEGATVRYSYDGTTYNTDGSENGFRFQTDGRYYLVAGGQYTVTQGSQVQLGDEAYELFCDGTGIGFIYPENTHSVEYFVNSGNVVVGAAARELAETYEINGGTMVVNTGSIAGERIHFNTDAAALNIGGASHVTGTLTTTRGTTTVAGGEVDALTSTGGQVHVTGGHIGSLLFSGGSATLSGGSSGSLMVGAATVEVTGMHTTGRVRMSELGASTVVIKDGGNLTLSGTNNDHSTNRSFMLAHWPYASTLRQEGGLLNSPGATMFISWDGTGTYEAMGGVANLAGISFWGSSSNIRGKFYLGEAEGGTARVNIGANGISDISGSVQILLGNGTLGATADWRMHHNPSFTVSPVQLISTGQGTIFDTSDANYPTIGRTITVDVPFTGIGKLVKQGVGTLILNRASTHSGGTVIEAGELVAGNETALGSGKVYLAGGELKLNTELTVGEMEYTGGELNLNKKALNITRELTASRQLSLNSGILDIENGAIYNGKGIIAQAGTGTAVRVQNAELSHVGYDLTFNAGTALEVAGNSTIRGNVSLLADSLFKLEQAATLSLHETLQADAAELTVQGTALLEGSSTLNASLTLADGATLDMMSLDAGAVTINGALTFGGKVEMGENLLAAVEGLTCYAPGLVLFTGLTDLVLPVAASELESDRVLASSVFSNVVNPDLYVTYHVVDNVGSLLVMNVPEPATSTLSLLALTALAARRRRR